MQALNRAMERFLPVIEEELRRAFHTDEPLLVPFYSMMEYHMGWRDADLAPASAPVGKRLRPLLCMLACQAAGGDPQRALPAAAAIEILHNFSLVHDDIEDNSRTRRHRPAVWTLWGEANAINLGDGLFALAFLTIDRLNESGGPAEIIHRAGHALHRAGLTLTEGQYLDISFETRFDIRLPEYLHMIRCKTAALLSTAAYIGALLAGSGPMLAEALCAYGEALGMMFQIQDDILGIWGEEAKTGKPSGSDIVQRKKALPLVYAVEALEKAGDTARVARLREIYALPSVPAEGVEKVISILEEAGARRACEEQALAFYRQALGYLDDAAAAPAHDPHALQALREMAGYLLGREA